MARKTTTTTTTGTATTAKTAKRVTSLEPKAGVQLTSLEEAVVRMHHGISVKPEAELPTNGVTREVMGQLLEMEVRAHVESGRIDDLPDVPAEAAAKNARTEALVSALKQKL